MVYVIRKERFCSCYFKVTTKFLDFRHHQKQVLVFISSQCPQPHVLMKIWLWFHWVLLSGCHCSSEEVGSNADSSFHCTSCLSDQWILFHSISCIFILFYLWCFLLVRLRIEVRMRARILQGGFSYSLANRLSCLWLHALSMNATCMHLFVHQVRWLEETPVTPDQR